MYQVYKLMMGETIEDVANKLGIDVEYLKSLNSDLNNLYIVIPSNNDSMFTRYVVKKGDTIYDIARISNIEPSVLLRLNGLNNSDIIYPNQEILIPNEGVNVYITEENDTIGKILDNTGNSIEDIIKNNPNLYLMQDQIVIY